MMLTFQVKQNSFPPSLSHSSFVSGETGEEGCYKEERGVCAATKIWEEALSQIYREGNPAWERKFGFLYTYIASNTDAMAWKWTAQSDGAPSLTFYTKRGK